MNVVQVLNVKLQRNDQNISWGFNVQGGKEFNCPLVIQRVTPNSLADRCSIKPGDFILRVGSMSTEHLTHNQARDAIVRQGNNLELTLQRGAPPRSEDYQARLDFPQHQLMTPENVEPKSTLSPQVGVQLSKNKALLTQSYNSPMGLYSSQNIADTLVSSIKNDNINTPSLSTSPNPSSTSSNNHIDSLISEDNMSTDNNPETAPVIRRTSTSAAAKQVIIERLSSTLANTKHAFSSNDLKLMKQANYSNFSSKLKSELDRIKANNKNSSNNNLANNNSSYNNNFSQNIKSANGRRISNIANLKLNFECKQVGTLEDPSKPSLTQSRSFKLLQDTLENGLLVNDTIIRDSLTNKSHRRRCSLVTTDRLFNSTSNNNLNSSDKDENDDFKVDHKKLYIRSLSLANNESAEPIYRFRNSILHKVDQETNED